MRMRDVSDRISLLLDWAPIGILRKRQKMLYTNNKIQPTPGRSIAKGLTAQAPSAGWVLFFFLFINFSPGSHSSSFSTLFGCLVITYKRLKSQLCNRYGVLTRLIFVSIFSLLVSRITIQAGNYTLSSRWFFLFFLWRS